MSPPAAGARPGGQARLAVAASLLIATALFLPYRGYLTDDTFIHLQFAKHVSRGEGFAFNRGEPTYGATSPLWVALLAVAGKAGVPVEAPRDPVAMPPLAVAAKLLGAGFALAAVWLLAAAVGRLGWGPRAAAFAAGMMALHAWSARWALSGMETPLAVACAAGSLYLLARLLAEGRGAVRLGLCLAAGGLARPELHLFALLALAAVLAAGRRARAAAIAAAGYGAVTIPWLVLCWTWFHRILPNTAAAKAGAWLDAERAVAALRSSAEIFLATEAVPIALFLVALAVGGAVLSAEERPRRALLLLAVAWPLALAGALAAAGTQVVSRYLLPATPCVLLLGTGSLERLSARMRPGRAGFAYAAALLLYAAPNLYLNARVALPSAIEHTRGLRQSLVSIGLWARESTPPGAEFALPDIGAFGYYSERRVLDLFGLVTPRMAPIVTRSGYDTVVRETLFESVGRPRYLIDRAREPDRLGGPGGEPGPYRFLFSRAIPNLGVTRPTQYVYSVYEIDWRVFDEMHIRTAGRPLDPSRELAYNSLHGARGAGIGGCNQVLLNRLP